MTTPSEYIAAKSAVRRVLRDAIQKLVPAMFQGMITDIEVTQLAHDTAHAALDAAAQERALAAKP